MTAAVADPFVVPLEADWLNARPALRQMARTLADAYAAGRFVTAAALEEMGRGLWQALDGEVTAGLEAARHRAGAATLPIIIQSAAPSIQQLPWETLHHPTYGFLGLANGFTLVRQVQATPPTPLPPPPGPLRVLLFTTLPDDLDAEKERLDIEEEQAQVLEALLPWIQAGVVALEMPDDGRLETLEQLLSDFRPHLVFLSGHGRFVTPLPGDGAPYAIFLMENPDGSRRPVRGERLAQAFLGSGVRAVVLSACESGKTASDAVTAGLTWSLSASGLPHVIGMRESVLDRAGTLFVRRLCEAVVRQERLDVATQQGRQAIRTPLRDAPLLGGEASGLAERSLGQWCLPMLLSHAPAAPLVVGTGEHTGGEHTGSPLHVKTGAADGAPRWAVSQRVDNVVLPARFVGRRRELRQLQSRQRAGRLRQLLIIGPGGQGKTALAGRLALDSRRQGYTLLAWSVGGGEAAMQLELEATLALTPENSARYTLVQQAPLTDEARLHHLLRLLCNQTAGRLLLFLDDLESVQDPHTQAVTDARLAAWLAAAHSLTAEGLILLVTSRWRLPGWPEADVWPLEHPSYGDFLQLARLQGLPAAFFRDRTRLRRIYQALHGNARGLIWFIAATQGMDAATEEVFMARLAQVETELQANMALTTIVDHLPSSARELLGRLPVYDTPVPREGILKLALDWPRPEELLERLLAVSLLEVTEDPHWLTRHYQLSPLVADWLRRQGWPAPPPALWQAAADYQVYLYRRERGTVEQAIHAHRALQAAGDQTAADRLALDHIVGRLSLQGLYRTLLETWLPPISQSPDPRTRAQALGQIGKQYVHLGDYAAALAYLEESLAISRAIGDKAGEGTTLNNISQIFQARGDYAAALAYLEESLAISRAIGDVAGLCATLFNIGHIHYQKDEVEQALNAWVTVYRLAYPRQLAQLVQALADLADQLGLPGGLAAWEQLARRWPA